MREHPAAQARCLRVNDTPAPSARLSLLAGAGVFGITYGLTSPLIALELTRRGYSEFVIGLNASMQALGVLTVALCLPRFTQWIGMRRVLLITLAAVAAMLCAFPLAPWMWLRFPLRYALGAASEGVMVTTESWTSQLSDTASRATDMAAYTAVVSIGMAIGPLLLGHVGTGDAVPFLLAAALAMLALAVVIRTRTAPTDTGDSAHPIVWRVLLREVPLALAATALNAALETAGLSFLPLYAMKLGWTEQGATFLLSALLIGAIVLQVPIGLLGVRFEPRRLVVLCGVLSAAEAMLWPLVIARPVLAYALMFVWGGAFVGIYTLMVTIVGSRYRGSALVAVYAGMSMAFGVGALVGPLLAGVFVKASLHGLPIFAAAACAPFSVYAWLSAAES